jgi:signal transduction histidine kinase
MGTVRLTPIMAATGREVRIDYFGLAFGADQPLRFQVRLDGADERWSGPTTERSVRYAGLGPGKYEFQVRVVGPAGRTTAEPATVAFTVPPPVWRRLWSLALFAAAFVSLLLGAYRLRVRRLLELERVRTRIAADLHDDLGASLARVSLLTEAIRRTMRDRPVFAERMLGEIGETSRSLVSAAGDIAFSIDPGRGNLEALVARVRRFAEELLAGLDAEWAFSVQGKTADIVLSSDQRRHLLAILKEALSNAVRHGRPRRLTMTLFIRSDVVEVEIVDDGHGFAPDAADSPEPMTGHGLRNMRRRAGELGGSLDVDSGPGAGTRVKLVMPLIASRMSMR